MWGYGVGSVWSVGEGGNGWVSAGISCTVKKLRHYINTGLDLRNHQQKTVDPQ